MFCLHRVHWFPFPILFFSFISYFTKGKKFYKKDLEFLMSPHYILQSNQPLVWIALYIETTSSWLYTFALELEKGCHETLVSHHNSSRRSPDSKMWVPFTWMARKWDTGTQVSIMSQQWLRGELLDLLVWMQESKIPRYGGSQWYRYAVRGAYGDSCVNRKINLVTSWC